MTDEDDHENGDAGTYRTREPTVVEWVDGLDETHEVRVDPYSGSVTVNGREFDISVLCSDDIPGAIYREVGNAER